MKVIQVKDYQEMSQEAAKRIIHMVKETPNAVLGLATGGTPTGTYQEMVQEHVQNGTSYADIKTINLDEYVGMPPENPNSYYFFMKKNLFEHLDVQHTNTHIPDGTVQDLSEFCTTYDQLISANPIDLQLLGIGQNGHIGFNEPGTSFATNTHIVTLTHSTRKANARYFDSINEVPTHAITMGIASILQSKSILLLASGIKKAEAIRRLLNEPEHPDFPASALKSHPNVTLIADEEAFSLVEPSKRRLES